jgi:putative ATPase
MPLAARMRPHTVADFIGQESVLAPGTPLAALLDGVHEGTVSVILYGPPGTGKTTLASLISQSSGRRLVELSAVTAGVRDVRAVIEEAKNERTMHDRGTVLFIDEVHRFSKSQQDALLPAVEHGWVTLVAATTENPHFSVISPLLCIYQVDTGQ